MWGRQAALVVVGSGLMALPPSNAGAEYAVQDYRNLQDQSWFQEHLTSVAQGFSLANRQLSINGKTPLYCLSDNHPLDKKMTLSLIDQGLKNGVSGAPWREDSMIEIVLLASLREQFPCRK